LFCHRLAVLTCPESSRRNTFTQRFCAEREGFATLVPNLFSVMDPYDDLAESCGPLKPVNTVTHKWSLLEKVIIRFARQQS